MVLRPRIRLTPTWRRVGRFMPCVAMIGVFGAGAPPVSAAGDEPMGAQSGIYTSAARPTAWCGDVRSTDDARNEVRNGRHKFHAVYMVPHDQPGRFSTVASPLQADAFAASALLERLYGRAIRFDVGTPCGPGYLDVSVVRTQTDDAGFRAAALTEGGTMRLVRRELRRNDFDVIDDHATRRDAARLTRNFLVWLDAPGPASTCGLADTFSDPRRAASNWNNFGGKVAVVLRPSGPFCGAQAVRHEIAHTLGALQHRAPNASAGGHCDDAYEDTMCYPAAPRQGHGSFANEFFDYGNDDYWDPPVGRPLRWWTLNLSSFICADVSCASARPSRAATARAAGRMF